MSNSILAKSFTSKSRSRGESYYRRGAVRVTSITPTTLNAKVRGSQLYDVSLIVSDEVIEATCTCPYFVSSSDPCKHIWATLLAAEKSSIFNTSQVRYVENAAEDDDDYDPDEWVDGNDDIDEIPHGKPNLQAKSTRKTSWQKALSTLKTVNAPYVPQGWPAGRQILYVIDLPACIQKQVLSIEVCYCERKRDGEWSKPKAQAIDRSVIPTLTDPADRELLTLMAGASNEYGYGYHYESSLRRCQIDAALGNILLPRLCATGRCYLRGSSENSDLVELHWSDARWQFRVNVSVDPTGKFYEIVGQLWHGDETLPLTAATLLVPGACVIGDRLACFEHTGAFSWIDLLRRETLIVPISQSEKLLTQLFSLPSLPTLRLPDDLRVEEITVAPQPCLKINAPKRSTYGSDSLEGILTFDYQGVIVAEAKGGDAVFQAQTRQLIRRDRHAESVAVERLMQLGFKNPAYWVSNQNRQLPPKSLPNVVRRLLAEGWHVEAEGKLYRKPGNFNMEVRSSIDWFELHGRVEFGEQSASLPDLLAALKRGDNIVQLGDGTFGMVPEDWLKKYGMLAGLGTDKKDHVQFSKSQVGLLDALLATQPDVNVDEVFQHARDELKRFAGIEPAEAPPEFVGELRGYQREGLGWLEFLQRFGFGGCLADDMGLGKTVQVLAMLEKRRHERSTQSQNGAAANAGRSALVVVPKSLVFNWKQEAARFAPKLRVLDHTGIGRLAPGEHFGDYDIILTTYGTLRRDALSFKDLTFDYVILDESQAIKNANSESAKVVRLLQGKHRLAMSGTPVENHLGELWSLFEFLNPGMLGSASVFRLAGGAARNPDEETRKLLAMGLRPFILRRTKEQVAKDLPEKLEQTLYCDLDAEQRKYYDELRDHYRATLLDRIDREGMHKAKMHVLEALLRLRQAACHPGLIDKSLTKDSSAKLDILLTQIENVLQEGHKALVFSQFTSLLAIVRERLDADKISYEYLDGRTRKREDKVKRFQEDADCRLFLISLKAGGVGLNLTAADYVFLLDPWWNPAVEAQAIDRTHRIGQTRRVFAYRLIARNTVEEKVLELQQSKRDLADAIINADNGLVRNLAREDIELLLS